MTTPENLQKNIKKIAPMNWSAALMKDGGKPMGPTPAEKKKAEERAKKKAEHIAFTKECIMKYAERSEEKDLIAYIQKQPFWTDPVNNLKELEIYLTPKRRPNGTQKCN